MSVLYNVHIYSVVYQASVPYTLLLLYGEKNISKSQGNNVCLKKIPWKKVKAHTMNNVIVKKRRSKLYLFSGMC